MYSIKKNQKFGFTLIELLVVIAIIGLLSTVVISAVGVARVRARDAKRLTDIKQIKTGMDLYYSTADGGYPPEDLFIANFNIDCNGTPIIKIPADPLNDAVYNYTYETSGDPVVGCGRNDLVLNYTITFRLEKTGAEYTMNEDGQFSPSIPEL